MPFISAKKFSLCFSNEVDHLAIGKISIGYHDMDGELEKYL